MQRTNFHINSNILLMVRDKEQWRPMAQNKTHAEDKLPHKLQHITYGERQGTMETHGSKQNHAKKTTPMQHSRLKTSHMQRTIRRKKKKTITPMQRYERKKLHLGLLQVGSYEDFKSAALPPFSFSFFFCLFLSHHLKSQDGER